MTRRRTLWLIFTAFVVYGGTIPFHFDPDLGAAASRFHRLVLNPLLSPETGRRLSFPDVVQNLLLFLPFGAFGFAAGSAADRTWRRVLWVGAMGALLSCAVETLQLFARNRVASVADVLANTVGAVAGAGAMSWVFHLDRAVHDGLRRRGLTDSVEFRTLLVVAGALLVAWLEPFDFTLDRGLWAAHVVAFLSNPWQFTVLRDEGMMLLVAALFAMSLASYLLALGQQRVGRRSAAIGVAAVCVLEASQVGIGSRTPGLWDAAVGSAGIVAGTAIWVVSARVDWPALWRGVLILMTAIGAALLSLSPFEISPSYRGLSWFPMLGYYTRTTPETLSHVIELGLAYFPLGFALGLSSGDRGRMTAIACGLTLAIAVPVEYFQGWIVNRYADVSDVLVSVAGTCVGAWVAQHRTTGLQDHGSVDGGAARDKSRRFK